MNRCQKHPQSRIKNPPCRQAFARLDTALAQNAHSDRSENLKTQLWLLKMFGRPPGTMEIPK